MKRTVPLLFFSMLFLLPAQKAYCWGFYAHQKINRYAVFLLPPGMMVLYKPNILFLAEHATDPDKRRFAVPAEGPRHYIDIDHYGSYPFRALPRKWSDAVAKYGKDTLMAYGIAPWNILGMLGSLTDAFREKNFSKIMKYSAELGHYIADAHVPLHTHSNHNGQYTNQKGIHAFWESRVPELLCEKEFDFFIGHAQYLENPSDFIWKRILESALAADSVLNLEKELTRKFRDDKKFAFEEKNGLVVRTYSSAFTIAYNNILNGMVERRMRQSVFSIASFWYTAWVNAGQPALEGIAGKRFTETELREFEELNSQWLKGGKMIGKEE